jgi:hypothetical protein
VVALVVVAADPIPEIVEADYVIGQLLINLDVDVVVS